MLTQYATFALFQDKKKAKFSNDLFGIKNARPPNVIVIGKSRIIMYVTKFSR